MTGKELCETYVRFKYPQLETEYVGILARRLWAAHPCGELHHLEDLRIEMIAGGALPSDTRPERPVYGDISIERNEAGGATKYMFDGSTWLVHQTWRKE